MNYLNKLLLLILSLYLISCDEKLPKPTQEGADIIACKVNGKAWIAQRGTSFGTKKYSLIYNNQFKPKRQLVIHANNISSDHNSSIQLAFEDVRAPGTYHFSSDTNPYPAAWKFKDHAMYIESKPENANYITNSRHTGWVTFTRVDTVNFILSGIFEFTAENYNAPGKTIKITDGRFDLKYSK